MLYSTASQKATWSVAVSTQHQDPTSEFGPVSNDASLLIDAALSDPTSTSGLRASLFYIKYAKNHPWVEVNLGANFTVSGVILHNRRDCCSSAFQVGSVRFDVSSTHLHRPGIQVFGNHRELFSIAGPNRRPQHPERHGRRPAGGRRLVHEEHPVRLRRRVHQARGHFGDGRLHGADSRRAIRAHPGSFRQLHHARGNRRHRLEGGLQ